MNSFTINPNLKQTQFFYFEGGGWGWVGEAGVS